MWKPKFLQKLTEQSYIEEYDDVFEDDFVEESHHDAHHHTPEQPHYTMGQHISLNNQHDPTYDTQHAHATNDVHNTHTVQSQTQHTRDVVHEHHIDTESEQETTNIPEENIGELQVDVYQTPDEIIVRTMVAGIPPSKIDISLTRDMLTITGEREEQKEVTEDNYFYRELSWGSFTRTISLPAEVEVDEADAKEKHGILTIRLPKINRERQAKVKVKSH